VRDQSPFRPSKHASTGKFIAGNPRHLQSGRASAYTKDQLVEQPAIALFAERGRQSLRVSALHQLSGMVNLNAD